MPATSASLLDRLRRPGEDAAWARFVDLYTPLLYHWARRTGLAQAQAADLVQDVLVVLVRKLPEFTYDRTRSFRSWLRTVTLNKWREDLRPERPGGPRRAPLAATRLWRSWTAAAVLAGEVDQVQGALVVHGHLGLDAVARRAQQGHLVRRLRGRGGGQRRHPEANDGHQPGTGHGQGSSGAPPQGRSPRDDGRGGRRLGHSMGAGRPRSYNGFFNLTAGPLPGARQGLLYPCPPPSNSF
jgi:DNA-directed RNA polymerase specialized sigma24 family protein